MLRKEGTNSPFSLLSSEVVFQDEEETDMPTDLASLSTIKRCFRGDEGRPCSSCLMAFPNACLEWYGVSYIKLLVGFIDFFDR